ncbi:MAG: SHOCT domain-containing protein [Euryarchaeota archaeon]|nr:SHOCT domain-containing protein [Euryarchaeota archaeon]
MGYMMSYYGYGWMLLGLVFMVLFWAAVILLILWLYKQLKGGAPATSESALDILKKRYAKGEITREEFELMRKDFG